MARCKFCNGVIERAATGQLTPAVVLGMADADVPWALSGPRHSEEMVCSSSPEERHQPMSYEEYVEVLNERRRDAADQLEPLCAMMMEMIGRLRSGMETDSYAAVRWLQQEVGQVADKLGDGVVSTAAVASYYRNSPIGHYYRTRVIGR